MKINDIDWVVIFPQISVSAAQNSRLHSPTLIAACALTIFNPGEESFKSKL